MGDEPRLSTDLLKPYFKNMHYRDEIYQIDVYMFSKLDQIAFEVSLECKEPGFSGAFPQRRYSLERHSKIGHEGVHIQINYHLVDNDMKVGRLYIVLDVMNDEELLHVAEGFVVILYEILRGIDRSLKHAVEQIFNTAAVRRMRRRKELLLTKINESLQHQQIKIRSTEHDRIVVYKGKEFLELISERKELSPLLGPLIEMNGGN